MVTKVALTRPIGMYLPYQHWHICGREDREAGCAENRPVEVCPSKAEAIVVKLFG